MFFKGIILSFLLISPLTVGALSQPNIILITADDLGFDDLSLHKHPYINTPHIDRLAQASVQFTDFTVTPVCSTTRAALLTGRDFYKTGVSGVHGGRDFMHRSEYLMSEMLQTKGYKTGTWGKWHLGKTEGYYPWNRGFNQAYYAELYRHKNSFGWLNGAPVKHNKWVSEVVTDYAIQFIQQQKDQPFFAYLSYLAPHEPWLAPDKYVQPLIQKGLRPAIANLYGMVNEMDFHIGRLMQHLRKEKLLDNTIVIFMSDNGPWWDSSNFGAMTKTEWAARNPNKMLGNKGQSWQNGIRSPLFVHWPAKFKANKITRYVDVKDLFPTLQEIVQAKLPKTHEGLDGHSMLNYLQGNLEGKNPRTTYIASHDVISQKKHFNQWTPIDKATKKQMYYAEQLIGLRTEQYKLLLNPSVDRPHYPLTVNRYALFDMQADPLEQHNIYLQQPKTAQRLSHMLETKFNSLLTLPNSYAAPVYVVGQHPVSVINGFGPATTQGNTLSQAHQLTQLKQSGDSATYQLDVLKAGRYKVYIKQKDTNAVGLRLQLDIADSRIEFELNEHPLQKLTTVTLPTGETSLRLAVVANNSIKPWSAINGLRRFYLVREDYQHSPLNWPVPN